MRNAAGDELNGGRGRTCSRWRVRRRQVVQDAGGGDQGACEEEVFKE